MNIFKNFIYKLLYKNTGQQVMGALTNCEAYETYKKTNSSLDKKIQENISDLKNTIENNIYLASVDGKFKATSYYNSRDYNKQNINYIKQDYKKKGYKVKILWANQFDELNRTITISWKHWKKNN